MFAREWSESLGSGGANGKEALAKVNSYGLTVTLLLWGVGGCGRRQHRAGRVRLRVLDYGHLLLNPKP